ncbi:MAG: iron-binding protein [Actinobacteria bacterium]|nr:iron-binding protein [Actinomycetota bacterium]
MSEPKIKIVKNGPYLVSGNVPISEKKITSKGKEYTLEDGRELPQSETYALCRCGHSKNPPFCDGSHVQAGFDGTETASWVDYLDRIEKTVVGPDLDLLDDGRCAFARFCHRNEGKAWDLIKSSDDPHLREEAIAAAYECPAGRLTARDKMGNLLDEAYEPSIEILQDPEKGVSGPISVKGKIPLESADGFTYELRNRMTLCRCGYSENKPFCDACHVGAEFRDSE